VNVVFAKKSISTRAIKFIFATAVCAVVNSPQVHAQNLISNGGFDNGLTDWTQSSWAGGSLFGINANGPANTSAASGNYAYAGGGTYNLLQQNISGLTTGNAYRLTFLAGSKSGQGNANGILSLFDGQAGNYNSASFDYKPSDAVFGSYTVDFTARGATDLWLRSDSTYAAYDNVSVTAIGSVANALNYSSASGFSQISSALTGSGKVTSNAGTGGLTLSGANTHTGGTEVTGGTLFVTGAGTLGAASGNVTVTGTGGSEVKLDLRNQQTLTGTITMTGENARIIAGDANNVGSLVNNGSIQFGGGKLAVAVSGTGGINVTGGGTIDSSNSYTGATTISGTTGWYGTHQLFVNNANALGAASGDLTISGGSVNLQNNTITRSGNVTISGGSVETGTISKSGSDYIIQGGSVGAVLAGTAGLTKSGSATASLGGANTYSGGTTINGGTLSLYSAGGLGNAAGAVTVNTGGTLYTHSGLTISRTGDVTVNGGSLSTDNFNMGTISVSGGNFIANNAAVLAVKLAGTAGLTVGGAGETYLWTDSSYTGATVISGGQLTLGGSGAISSQSRLQIDSGAAVNLTGAYAANNINRTFAGLTGAGVLYGGGGTVTVNKSSGTDTFSGDIQGAQGLIKAGAGNVILAGANSFSGATAVNAGLLKVASGGSISSSSTTVNTGGTFDVGGTAGSVQVNSGGLLKGSGSVGAFTLASGGTLTPGNSPGTLTAASATILGGSTYNWEIKALTGEPGTTWDLFSVTNLLDMSGVTDSNKWNLVVTGDSGFAGWTDTSSYSYVFAQAASVSGFSSTAGTDVTSLFNITTSGIASKPNASFNANGDFKVVVGSANGFTTLNLMAVPEPSTGSMLGLGFAGLVATRLLRRKNS
jgi:fibronectin-binding autotransporter adhesin